VKSLVVAFEALLWKVRYLVMIGVLGSLVTSCALFIVTTKAVLSLVVNSWRLLIWDGAGEGSKYLAEAIVSDIVKIVDGYLLAAAVLIFAFGLYELFISKLDIAHRTPGANRILAIESLDDLKASLGKVVLIVLAVAVLEQGLAVTVREPLELVYLGGGVALLAIALYLTHAHSASRERTGTDHPERGASKDRESVE
jgi:uncharacterized membrane protein YqhA